MGSSTRKAYGESPQISIGSGGSEVTLTLHSAANGSASTAEAGVRATGSRRFDSDKPQVIADSDGSVPVILTVHSFDPGGFGVKVNIPGETLEWTQKDFHKSYQRQFTGEAELTWFGALGATSQVSWSFE